jgi:three-Cys-motif partner protein
MSVLGRRRVWLMPLASVLVADVEPIWELKPHTRVKHELLRSYLDAWFPILAHRGGVSKRLLFVDGFAGPGVYKDGEPGSPIVALNAIASTKVDLSHCEFVFLFVEANGERVESLNRQIAAFMDAHHDMPNVKIQVEQSEFRNVAQKVLDRLDSEGAQLAPTLAMVDPFGFGGVPMELIAKFLRFPRCEVLFNFMLDSINRHANNVMVSGHMEALFGCDGFNHAPPAGNPSRQPFLRDLYGRQLRDVAKFTYVSRFDLVNELGRNNSLFHGTRHLMGLKAMRQAAWRSDPVEGRGFDARVDPNVGTLFGGEPNLEPLRDAIAQHFMGKRVNLKVVHDFVLTDTPYNPSSHLKKHTLKVLESEGWILNVEHPLGKARKKGTFPDGCWITFAEG